MNLARAYDASRRAAEPTRSRDDELKHPIRTVLSAFWLLHRDNGFLRSASEAVSVTSWRRQSGLSRSYTTLYDRRTDELVDAIDELVEAAVGTDDAW